MSGKTPASEKHASAIRDVMSKVFLAVASMAFGAVSLLLYRETDGFTKLRLAENPVSSVATTARASETSEPQEISSQVSVADEVRETRDNLSGFQKRGRDPAPPRMRESGMYAGGQYVEPGFTPFYKSSLTGLVGVSKDVKAQVFDIRSDRRIYIKWDSIEQARERAANSELFLILKDNSEAKPESGRHDILRDDILNDYNARYLQTKATWDHQASMVILEADPTVTVVSFPDVDSGELVLLSFGPDLSTLSWGTYEKGLLFQL